MHKNAKFELINVKNELNILLEGFVSPSDTLVFSHVAPPIVRGRKWIKKALCLSEASFKAFPFSALYNWEPEGQ
jgi:hypothetical protein